MRFLLMNDLKDIEIFNRHLQTLKELSKDDSENSQQYMTDSEIIAISFDEVKEEYATEFVSQAPKSVDAILPIDEKILFIEFKNGKIKDKQSDSIVIKILESLLMFCDIADCKISQVREVADLILVYNAEKNPPHSQSFKNFADEIGKLAGEKNIRFKLSRLKKIYFREVSTLTEAEFDKFLRDIKIAKSSE